MLSITTEYGLRMMIALIESPEDPLTAEQIAQRTGVPADYAIKVLKKLAGAQLVLAQRGRGGGFRLVDRPEPTTVLDVVQAIRPLEWGKRAPRNSRPHGGDTFAALHQRIDGIQVQVENGLRSITLRSIAAAGPASAACGRLINGQRDGEVMRRRRHVEADRAALRLPRDGDPSAEALRKAQ
jgi:Rrf2 family protein